MWNRQVVRLLFSVTVEPLLSKGKFQEGSIIALALKKHSPMDPFQRTQLVLAAGHSIACAAYCYCVGKPSDRVPTATSVSSLQLAMNRIG